MRLAETFINPASFLIHMKITLHLDKSLEENAGIYFDKAKKAKKKLEGLKEAMDMTEKKLKKLEKRKVMEKEKKPSPKKEWYEKFRWMLTSKGSLVVGGRDATTNDILIKKHMEPDDTVFHADIAGSPFCLLKSEKPSPKEKEETAVFCAINSKAFSLGLSTSEVYAVKPDQIGFSAPAGEYMQKGSFMINGKKEYFNPELEFAAGLLEDGRVMCGPLTAVEKNCQHLIRLRSGDRKKSDIVRLIQNRFDKHSGFEIAQEQVMSVLPPGSFSEER